MVCSQKCFILHCIIVTLLNFFITIFVFFIMQINEWFKMIRVNKFEKMAVTAPSIQESKPLWAYKVKNNYVALNDIQIEFIDACCVWIF